MANITVLNRVGAVTKDLASIDLNLLVALDALLSERSVTGAARVIGMTQPGMSNALARLRKTFGDPLLVRAGAAMTLTPRAQSLAAPLREALRLVEQSLLDERDFSPVTDSARFRISCSDYSVLMLMGPLVRRLMQIAPNVTVDVVPRAQDPVALLRDASVDLVIEPAEVMPDARLPYVTLFEDYWRCCIWAGSPLPDGGMTREEYLRRGHVVFSMGGQDLISLPDAYLKRAHLDRKILMKVESFLLAPNVLQGTDMVTIVPSRAVPYLQQDVRVLDLPLPVPPFTERLWWHPRHTADPAHTWLREQIAEVASQSERAT